MDHHVITLGGVAASLLFPVTTTTTTSCSDTAMRWWTSATVFPNTKHHEEEEEQQEQIDIHGKNNMAYTHVSSSSWWENNNNNTRPSVQLTRQVFASSSSLYTGHDDTRAWPRRLLFPDRKLGMIMEQEPLLGHLRPAPLLQLMLKSFVITFALRTNAIQHRVDELEARNELPENLEMEDIFSPAKAYQNEFNLWNGFVPNVKIAFTRDFCVTTILRLYEHITVFLSPYKVARSMTKSITQSAIRKINRGMPKWLAAQKMVSSAFSAQILYWSALFTFSMVNEGMFVRGKWPLQLLPARVIAKHCYRLLVRCVSGCFLGSFGAALGTLIFPGPGTLAGSVLVPSVALIFLA